MLQLARLLHSGIRSAFVAIVLVFSPMAANAGFYFVEEVRPMLLKADANNDGYLSQAEVRAENAALMPGFEKADINCDGKLDLGEFEILLISL